MTILEQIGQEIDAVTEEQVEALTMLDVQEGEEILGNVADYPYIHRVWALAHEYGRRSSLAAHSARFGGPKNREQLVRETHWLDTLESLVRDLAWTEIRRLVPQLFDHESIGLRTGWVLVKAQGRRQEINETIVSLRNALQKAFSAVTEKEDEEEKIM